MIQLKQKPSTKRKGYFRRVKDSSASDLYLTFQNNSISFHSTLTPGSRISNIYVQRILSKYPNQNPKHCSINAATKQVPGSHQAQPIADPPFSVRQEDPPYIYLNRNLNYSSQEEVVDINLTLECWSGASSLSTSIQLRAYPTDSLDLASCGGTSSTTRVNTERHLCFQDPSVIAEVSEGVASVPIASAGSLDLLHNCNDRLTRSYTISHNDNSRRQGSRFSSPQKTNYADHVTIDDITGVITVVKPFDREKKQMLAYIIMCHVYDRHSDTGAAIYTASARFTLKIKDIDDNPPVILTSENRPDMQFRMNTYRLSSFKARGKNLSIKDDDLPSSNTFDVRIVNDFGNFFVLSPLKSFYTNYYQTTIYLRDNLAQVPNGYTVDVVFEDSLLIGSNQTKAIYRITVDSPYHASLSTTTIPAATTSASQKPMQADTPFVTVDVAAEAAPYSQLVQISDSDCGEECYFKMHGNHTELFGVTPNEGLLYVKDENLLYKMSGRVLELDILRGKTSLRVLVSVKGDMSVHKPYNHCAEKPSGPSSMNLANDHLPLGIKSCASPVWCSSSSKCHCTPMMSIKNDSGIMNLPWMNTYRQDLSRQTPPPQANDTTSGNHNGKYEGRVAQLCDHSCRVSLVAVLVGTVCMTVAITALCCLWRGKCRREKMKTASSILSLSGVASDYSHNERGLVNINNVDWSAKIIYNSLD
ncbi:hypothetical protein CAPTEDRAFT_187218, partial [Capitella teleta]